MDLSFIQFTVSGNADYKSGWRHQSGTVVNEMKTLAQLNLVVAWILILLGFLSGFGLGLFFHREEWLGGYSGFRRRLYRLAHISFFGLGAANLFFYLTVRLLAPSHFLTVASNAFVIGSIAMPICCLLMAHFPKARLLFAIPVSSLLVGGTLTLVEVVRL